MNGPPSILLIIADAMLRQSIAEHLADSLGAAVAQLAEDEAPAQAARSHHLIILDAEANGALLCGSLRDDGITAPLLLLGGDHEAADEVMAKPLRLGTLAAKASELLARRAAGLEPIRIGPWRLEPQRRLMLRDDGRMARLTDKEAAILARLAQAGGVVVARDVLLAEIWGYGDGIDTHTLETHIYRLRRKIDPGGELLQGEGGGYRLASPAL
ncbi:hypothetical protein A6A04_02560 [Paramagnetospirillum marisnigri]|uniref:OmpR/PhoB-type domain-containing protein n=1 Tax=Paramagnetospirillum marisnigri TaxID=1285242 RepID=A0A178MNU5_9PROT|nr:response regulator transcription factor [Paramagnetospirillum marisnigri]OAN50299.1 hypothetical protein A6A04_02560 [Paramagnetospirillum marisnigri]